MRRVEDDLGPDRAKAESVASKLTRPRLGVSPGPHRVKLAVLIRAQLLENIRSGRWRVGDRLPTEPELGRMLGVSRAPVREAMQSLAHLGIVQVSPRRGTFVRALPIQAVMDLAVLSGSMNLASPLAEVYEFRTAVEGATSEQAARRAPRSQINILRSILERNVAAVLSEDPEEVRRVDVLFHRTIAEASGNRLHHAVMGALDGLLDEARRTSGWYPKGPEIALHEHRAIFEAIAHRDTAAARSAAESHVANTQARHEAAIRMAAPTPPGRALRRVVPPPPDADVGGGNDLAASHGLRRLRVQDQVVGMRDDLGDSGPSGEGASDSHASEVGASPPQGDVATD